MSLNLSTISNDNINNNDNWSSKYKIIYKCHKNNSLIQKERKKKEEVEEEPKYIYKVKLSLCKKFDAYEKKSVGKREIIE